MTRLRRLRGLRILGVTRRGKHQLLEIADGSVIHVHFRMAGDWVVVDDPRAELPRHARAVLELDDRSRVVLVDPRALSTIDVHEVDGLPDLGLGLEPDDPQFGARVLGAALATRRIAIKQALLDQRVVAGVGNIYAAEALWRARISPVAPAASLGQAELVRLVKAIREVLRAALERPGRYAYEEEVGRFAVYGREGEPCRRCRAPIERIVQAGRSTYYCPGCQPLSKNAPPRRPAARKRRIR